MWSKITSIILGGCGHFRISGSGRFTALITSSNGQSLQDVAAKRINHVRREDDPGATWGVSNASLCLRSDGSPDSLGYNPQEDQTREAVMSDVAIVGEMFIQR